MLHDAARGEKTIVTRSGGGAGSCAGACVCVCVRVFERLLFRSAHQMCCGGERLVVVVVVAEERTTLCNTALSWCGAIEKWESTTIHTTANVSVRLQNRAYFPSQSHNNQPRGCRLQQSLSGVSPATENNGSNRPDSATVFVVVKSIIAGKTEQRHRETHRDALWSTAVGCRGIP